jgi:hypothetical protein
MASTRPGWGDDDMTLVEARRWKAVTLANRGLTHRMVAEQLQEEYRRHNPNLTLVQIERHVSVDISRALTEYRRRTDAAVEEKITNAALRLNDIRRQLYRVLTSPHYVLYQGEIVTDAEGNPMRDDGPVLAALAQLRALEEQQARLEGTNAREKIDIAMARRVEEEATDVVEAILAGFAAAPELEPSVRQRVLEAAGAHLRTIEGEVVARSDDPPEG